MDTTAKKKMFINKFKNSIILLRLRKFTIVARGLATLLTLSRKKKKRCIKKNEHIETQFFTFIFLVDNQIQTIKKFGSILNRTILIINHTPPPQSLNTANSKSKEYS